MEHNFFPAYLNKDTGDIILKREICWAYYQIATPTTKTKYSGFWSPFKGSNPKPECEELDLTYRPKVINHLLQENKEPFLRAIFRRRMCEGLVEQGIPEKYALKTSGINKEEAIGFLRVRGFIPSTSPLYKKD